MSWNPKWNPDFRREWQVDWVSGRPAAIWRSAVKTKTTRYQRQRSQIRWIETLLFQLVRHQRQGWRPSLHAQVGQPAGRFNSYFRDFAFVSCISWQISKILHLSVVFHDKYQSYKYDQSYPHYMLMWASPQVHNNQLLYWTDSYFCDFAFVSCQLYFMKNIKVTNMQKYSREICPQGPQLPNLCWAKAEI